MHRLKLNSKKSKAIAAVLLALAMIIGCAAPSFAANYTMKCKALSAAKNSKTNYVIVTSEKQHSTAVYKINKNKKGKIIGVTEVISGESCTGGKKTPKGTYKITGSRYYYKNGSMKDKKGKSVYHEYYFTCYNNSRAIHTVLYKGYYGQYYKSPSGTRGTLFNKLYTQKAQDPLTVNWSNGCTRTWPKLSKYIYQNCGKGTAYVIY